MKNIILRLVGLGALCAALLSAQPASADLWCGDWEVGGHALYWAPVTCPWTYVRAGPPGTTSTAFEISAVPCNADWGFRVFGNYLCDCSLVGVSYQLYETTIAPTKTGPNLAIVGQDIEAATTRVAARARLRYQNVDVRVGQYLHRTCGCNVYFFGNARWVDLSYSRDVTQTRITTTGLVSRKTERSEFQGGALGAGVGADFDVWCNFGVFGTANLVGVIGERKTTNVFYDPFPGEGLIEIQASYPADTCILPEADFRIGINYSYTCGCWTLVGEVGYEVDYFWDVFAFPVATASLASQTFWELLCEDVGFSGLFFGARLLF